jgi:hypothetical protein
VPGRDRALAGAGHRPIDADTGDQGGTTEGVFVSEWQGDILYGRNEAVGGHYILAYAERRRRAHRPHDAPRRMLLWHANYHPDGGQLFFPLDRAPFYVPLALPGDDVTPSASSASASTAARASTSIRTSGTKACSACAARSASSTGRGGARARLGRLRARVRLPARSGDRVRLAPMKDSGPDPDAPKRRERQIRCPKCEYAPRPRPLGLHPELRDLVAHVLDRRRLPGCGLQWPLTQCPQCGQVSPHRQWYREPEASEADRVRESSSPAADGGRHASTRHTRLQGGSAWRSNSTT